MITLKKSNENQTISFIPKFYNGTSSYSIELTSEDELKTVYNQTVTTFTANKYYYNYTATFNLDEDTNYILKIKENTDTIFTDKVFCTNQTTYNINKDVYTYQTEEENSTDNQFILY